MKSLKIIACFIVPLFATLIPLQANAKIFRNAYISFELPDTWKCVLEHTEWVCRSETEKESKEAIIILTAKEVGPTDSMDGYTQHLNTPQQSAFKVGTTSISQITIPPKAVKINDQQWIDGLQLGSEIPNYYTRYLATIKDKIAILVTFSAHKTVYSKYSQDFFKAVQSLRVLASGNLLGRSDLGPLRPGSEMIGASINAAVPADMAGTEVANDQGSGGNGQKTKKMFLGIAAILAALGIYIWMKSRKS
jgi:hypothetical protein